MTDQTIISYFVGTEDEACMALRSINVKKGFCEGDGKGTSCWCKPVKHPTLNLYNVPLDFESKNWLSETQ